MTHEEAVERLHDLELDRLGDVERSDLEAHLADCAECRSIAGFGRMLRSFLRSEDSVSPDHPSSEVLVAYALASSELSGHDRHEVESHVARCSACSAQAAKVREVETATEGRWESSAMSRDRRGPAWWRQGTGIGLAASILAALLLYPAYLGIVRLPESARLVVQLREEVTRQDAAITDLEAARQDVAEEVERLKTWSGATGLQLVRSPLREKGRPTKIRVDFERPFAVLGVEMVIPKDVPDEGDLLFEIVAATGPPVVEVNVPVREARRQIQLTGVATLVIGTEALEPGRYELRVSAADRPSLLEVTLQVERTES